MQFFASLCTSLMLRLYGYPNHESWDTILDTEGRKLPCCHKSFDIQRSSLILKFSFSVSAAQKIRLNTTPVEKVSYDDFMHPYKH